MMGIKGMQKFVLLINICLMAFVVFMVGLYAYYGVTYMIYHSIPTIAAYLFFFYMIHRKWLQSYVWCVYTVITIYMIAATICLGYYSGFHLYCMSLVPVTYYTEYFAFKLKTKKPHALLMSTILVIVYLATTGYVMFKGAVYQVDSKVLYICMNINAVSVFCFLIGYTAMLHRMIVATELKLADLANTDQLTGLFNRHYMAERLDEIMKDISTDNWAAMIDIDDFKKLNDSYGHACGDHVLSELSKLMQDVCSGCIISRWGGEEFLIIGRQQSSSVLEKLRQATEHAPLSFQGNDLAVTITIGVSHYQMGQSSDGWIQSADNKLYDGKNNGKNQVVF